MACPRLGRFWCFRSRPPQFSAASAALFCAPPLVLDARWRSATASSAHISSCALPFGRLGPSCARSLISSPPRRLAAWRSALLALGHWHSSFGALRRSAVLALSPPSVWPLALGALRRSATLALSRHSAWPLVLGRLALTTSQRLAAGARRSPAIILARSSPRLFMPSASPSLALDLYPVTLSPHVYFHACLHARKCVFASLLRTGIAIPRSSAAWSLRHTLVDPRHSTAQALRSLVALVLGRSNAPALGWAGPRLSWCSS